MSDYLVLIREDERAHAAQAPRAVAELIVQRARFADELRGAGRLRDSGRFRPSAEGKLVRRHGDRIAVDAPVARDGKALAAYYWVDATSLADAEQLAGRVPGLASDA